MTEKEIEQLAELVAGKVLAILTSDEVLQQIAEKVVDTPLPNTIVAGPSAVEYCEVIDTSAIPLKEDK